MYFLNKATKLTFLQLIKKFFSEYFSDFTVDLGIQDRICIFVLRL